MNKVYTLGRDSMAWRNEVEELINLKDDKTKYEIVAINTINVISNKRIFVVGYGKHTDLPQFIKDVLFHTSDTIEDAVDYIVTILMA